MSSAWRRAKHRNESAATTLAACGAAGAYLAAIKQAEWLSPAYDVVVTRQGHPLRLDVVDPKTVLRHLADDWDTSIAASATHPWFRAEAAEYMRHLQRPDSPEAVEKLRRPRGAHCRQLPATSDEEMRTDARSIEVQGGGHLLQEKGLLVPWFQPMSAHIRS